MTPNLSSPEATPSSVRGRDNTVYPMPIATLWQAVSPHGTVEAARGGLLVKESIAVMLFLSGGWAELKLYDLCINED